MLSEEQLKRQERNKRYRLKILEKKNVSTQSTNEENVSKILEKIDTSNFIVFPLIISISAILVFFQTEVYLRDGLEFWLSLCIAIVCEVSLCYLSYSLKKSFVPCFLFASLFVYNLGVMSYSLRLEAEKTSIETNGENQHKELVLSHIKRLEKAIDIVEEKKDVLAISRYTKALDSLLNENKNLKVSFDWSHFKSYWFIALRAILMLLNAFLVHRISIRRKE